MASFDTGHKQSKTKPTIEPRQYGPVSLFVLRWGALTIHMDESELQTLNSITRTALTGGQS